MSLSDQVGLLMRKKSTLDDSSSSSGDSDSSSSPSEGSSFHILEMLERNQSQRMGSSMAEVESDSEQKFDVRQSKFTDKKVVPELTEKFVREFQFTNNFDLGVVREWTN